MLDIFIGLFFDISTTSAFDLFKWEISIHANLKFKCFKLLQSSDDKLYKCKSSGFVRSLPGGKIYTNKASLVVESEPGFRPVGGDSQPHRHVFVPRRGPLRRRRFRSRSAPDGAHFQAQLSTLQRAFPRHLPQNVQLLCRHHSQSKISGATLSILIVNRFTHTSTFILTLPNTRICHRATFSRTHDSLLLISTFI